MKKIFSHIKNKFLEYKKCSAILLGCLFTLGFAPFGLWPLAIVTIALMLVIVDRSKSIKKTFGLGLLFGMGHYLSSIHWLVMAFYMDFKSWPLALASGVPAVIALSFYLSLYMAACFAIYKKLTYNFYIKAICFAFAWVGFELLRSIGDVAFPWNLTGYIFTDNLVILQLAFYVKIYGLSFIAILIAALMKGGKKPFTVAAMILLIAMSCGYLRFIDDSKPINSNNKSLSVRIVQPNISQLEKWDPYKRFEHINSLLELSNKYDGFTKESPSIIIWPETAITTFLDEDPKLRRFLMNNLPNGSLLVTGAPRAERGVSQVDYYNSIMVLDNESNVSNVFDKRILVPFGEYVPFRNLLPNFIQKMVHGRGDYKSGSGKVTLKIQGINTSFVPLICFEAVLPLWVNRHSDGNDFLLVLTNDGWFDGTIAPAQHFAMVKVRSIETGKPLIRVANTGVSAVLDSKGKVFSRLSNGHIGYLDVDIYSLLMR